MLGWGHPLTVLSGLIAMLSIACCITLVKERERNELDITVVILAAGGLTATALYGLTLIVQFVAAIMQTGIDIPKI